MGTKGLLHAGYWLTMSGYGGAFEKLLWEPEEFIDCGEQVMVRVDVRSRPPGAAVDLVARHGHLWSLRNGVVLSMHSFPTQERALEAAGLVE